MSQSSIEERETKHRNRTKELDIQIDRLNVKLRQLKTKKEYHWTAIKNLILKKKPTGVY